LLLRSAEIQP
ncbi:hypothetical protein CLOP_g13776, partial [Closterium sp. NIES-67]